MNCYQTLAANTALMSIGTFGSKLLVFLMVRFYTGYLTPAEYGTADLITQTANLLIPLVSLDITDGVFRFAADRNSGRADVFSVGFRIITLGSLLMLATLALAKDVPTVHSYGLLLATFVIASCYHALCAHFVRAKGNTALFAVQGLFNTALFIGLNILFLSVFNWGIRGYVLSTTVANVITTVFLVWKERLWRYLRFERKRDLQRSMLRYCIPLIPAAIFWWIMGVSGRYMVNWFLGSDANGIYAVAYKIPTILTILAAVFMTCRGIHGCVAAVRHCRATGAEKTRCGAVCLARHSDSKRACRTQHAAAAAGSCFIPDPGVPAGRCDTAWT